MVVETIAVDATITAAGAAADKFRYIIFLINIPPHSGGYFIFGHSPNITGSA